MILIVFIIIKKTPDNKICANPSENWEDLIKNKADLFIAFGFGICKDPNGKETPGESNEEIAKWIIKYNNSTNKRRKPTIVQEGVYLALENMDSEVNSWVIRLPHNPEVYVDTFDATLQCWAIMTAYNYNHPVLVSHDLQLQRMVWNFEKIGLKELIIPYISNIPFDRSSQHWQTRSRMNWLLWELFFARPINYIRGQI